MPFELNGTTFVAYAQFDDVLARDQRVFDAHEVTGVEEGDDLIDIVNPMLARSTARINTLLFNATGVVIDTSLILSKKDDFTDMCVAHTLSEYLLPKLVKFREEEVIAIQFWNNKFNILFDELVATGGWYDEDEDGIVDDDEFANPAAVSIRLTR